MMWLHKTYFFERVDKNQRLCINIGKEFGNYGIDSVSNKGNCGRHRGTDCQMGRNSLVGIDIILSNLLKYITTIMRRNKHIGKGPSVDWHFLVLKAPAAKSGVVWKASVKRWQMHVWKRYTEIVCSREISAL